MMGVLLRNWSGRIQREFKLKISNSGDWGCTWFFNFQTSQSLGCAWLLNFQTSRYKNQASLSKMLHLTLVILAEILKTFEKIGFWVFIQKKETELFLLTLFRTTFQNNYSSRWGVGGEWQKNLRPPNDHYGYFFGVVHHTIPLGHKWKACWHKMSPLALKFLGLEPNKKSDPELENQSISRFRYLKIGT